MAKASDEMSHYAEYDFIVVNTDIEESVAQVEAIVTAERLRRQRQIGLSEFVKRLQEGERGLCLCKRVVVLEHVLGVDQIVAEALRRGPRRRGRAR